ncbi:MAG: c-type cytochrome biogenesis protein CcsB [Lachnospiraceae bacterium]|nr:c-type cytochrome biogenesis protein CcsB [Lachnospiraceae bacterium]MDD7026964.1 c-type cytochrome biogenesis protein CcsB [Lachnospiraceae bacterium]MDY5700405.1 c-type cytochrome biogenesis protein CcsB [Lachnospiraceae bacterium]
MITLKDNLDYLAFLLTITSMACMFLQMWLKLKWLPKAGLVLTGIAAAVMLVAIGIRTKETGSLPVNSVYEFILFFSLVMLFFTVFCIAKLKFYGLAAFILLAVMVMLGISFGLSDSITPLMPALQSRWRVAHVLTAIVSYSAFAVAFGVGICYLITIPRNAPQGGLPKEKIERGEFLEKLMFNSVVVGFIFLTLLIITGSIWAEDAWGAWWSWDPKETWALITWIIYAVYLHLHPKPKWRGRNGCYLSVIGFACVLFTLLGVSFFMGGLHSYGV